MKKRKNKKRVRKAARQETSVMKKMKHLDQRLAQLEKVVEDLERDARDQQDDKTRSRVPSARGAQRQ